MQEALSSRWLHGDGPFTKRAHELLRERLDGCRALLTTSCTHALELMSVLFDLQPGDEVVMPSFTFSSTANAPALRGVHIRFADIDPATWTMELPQLEAAVTKNTKAVFLMEYGGVCRDVARMVDMCDLQGIHVGEDAAHALFGKRDGQAYGTFAELGALSFHATKNVTCGEGGALIFRDDHKSSFIERALVLREKGTDRDRFLRGEIDRYTWRDFGSSWLPSDMVAALLCAQLESADALQAVRMRAWRIYREALAPHAERYGYRLQAIPNGVEHPAHVFGVVVPRADQRQRVLEEMAARGIQCTSHYEPLHLAPAAGDFCRDRRRLPVTEDVAARIVRLPLYSELEAETAESVASAFLDVVSQLDRAERTVPAPVGL